MEKTYITLSLLSQNTGLSKQVLKELAVKRKIPALIVGSRLRFNPKAVQQALDDLAVKGGGNE